MLMNLLKNISRKILEKRFFLNQFLNSSVYYTVSIDFKVCFEKSFQKRLDESKRRSTIKKSRCKSQKNNAEWSRSVAREAHNLKVVGSNPTSATKHEGIIMFTQIKQNEKRWHVEKPQHTMNPICDNAETK